MKPSIPAIQASKGADFCKGAAIVLLTIAAYLPVFHAGFVWDDDALLIANPAIKAADGFYEIWFTTKQADYFPLTSTSFWLEWRLWGMNPAGYHVTNVLLHALSAVVLWRVLKCLRIPGAYVAAVVFAVHPVNVESVAWIAQRKNTLCMVFFLLSVLWYMRSDDQRSEPRGQEPALWSASSLQHPTSLYCLSLLAFLCALLSKTAVVLLPFVLLLCHWWLRSGDPAARVKPSSSILHRPLLLLAPFFALSLGLGLVTVWFQYHRAIGEAVVNPSPLAARLAGAGWAVWFYLGKALVPVGLCFVYPRWEIDPRVVVAWLPDAGLMALLGLLWVFRQRLGRGYCFALAYFILMLFPVLGFFNIYFHRYSLVADHYQYQAMVGVVALLVACLARRIARPLARVSLALALIATLSCLSFQQAAQYRDERTLWQATLARNPTCWLAHIGFGLTSFNMGRFDEAIAHYQQSLQHGPENAEAHYDLALAFAGLGRLKEAEFEFAETIRLSPGHVESRNLLGNVLLQQGRPREAETAFRAVLDLDPNHAQAHNNLGCALAQQTRRSEAQGEFERALALDSQQVSAHCNLAKLWASEGKLESAMDQYRVAVKLDGDSFDARCGLGDLLLQAGRPREALEQLGRAVALRPDWAEGRYRYGLAFVAVGERKLGVAQYQEALRLQPDWVEVMNNLAWVLATAPEPAVRDGGEAVRLAERACELTGRTNWTQWDTLAAAYAQAARYPEAVRAAEEAVALAEATGSKNLAAQTRERLHLYQSSRAFQE
jgi:protein O-mannosyl-transferase